jgi:hypothetical protein
MTFPPDIPPAIAEQMQRMRDQAHARHAINAGVATVLEYARRRADHRAELWTPNNRAPYTLEPFIERVRTMSQVDAEGRLFGMFATPPDKPVHVTIVVPDWVNTCRGYGAPALEEPTWVRYWEPVESGVAPRHFPKVENAIALAAYGRRPSLIRADWDWAGIYPFGTMAYDPPPLEEFAKPCTAEPCDDAEGQAAA